jgi:hypothetical protein
MKELKKNYNRFFGSMVSNPFDGEDAEKPINIAQGVFVPNDPPGVYIVENMAHYNGVLLSVHLYTDEWSTAMGSAVMVAPGIAFTASHVLEEERPQILAGRYRVCCVGYTSSGPRFWRLNEFNQINDSDLAILTLKYASELPADGLFVQTMITTRLPGIGEKVMISGVRASRNRVEADELMRFPIIDGVYRYGVDVRIGVGEVTAHHIDNRRLFGLGGPVIEVSCSTPGGLSGGPAFDKDGKIFGILSSSIDDPDGRGPSCVSMIWPALAFTIRPAFLEHSMPASFRLLDLDDKLCGIDRREVIRTNLIGNGQTRVEWDTS